MLAKRAKELEDKLTAVTEGEDVFPTEQPSAKWNLQQREGVKFITEQPILSHHDIMANCLASFLFLSVLTDLKTIPYFSGCLNMTYQFTFVMLIYFNTCQYPKVMEIYYRWGEDLVEWRGVSKYFWGPKAGLP